MNELIRLLTYGNKENATPLDRSSGKFVWRPSLVSKFGDGVIEVYGKTLVAISGSNTIEVNLNLAEMVRLDVEQLKRIIVSHYSSTHKVVFIESKSKPGYIAYNCSIGFYYRENFNTDVVILPTGTDWKIHKENYRGCIEFCERYMARSDGFVNPKSFLIKKCYSCYRPYILEYDTLKRVSDCDQYLADVCCNCRNT